jgi:hypothetical protein
MRDLGKPVGKLSVAAYSPPNESSGTLGILGSKKAPGRWVVGLQQVAALRCS